MRGALIAFEGLDQSGKQTQTDALAAALIAAGHSCERLSFPDYSTAIGTEIHQALHGERDYAPDVMQLLYVANRYEFRARLETWVADGRIIVCDRYKASSIAYGEAQGLDAAWLIRDPAVPAGRRPDHPSRHPAEGCRRSEGRRIAIATSVISIC